MKTQFQVKKDNIAELKRFEGIQIEEITIQVDSDKPTSISIHTSRGILNMRKEGYDVHIYVEEIPQRFRVNYSLNNQHCWSSCYFDSIEAAEKWIESIKKDQPAIGWEIVNVTNHNTVVKSTAPNPVASIADAPDDSSPF